jgi:hypothetical protein
MPGDFQGDMSLMFARYHIHYRPARAAARQFAEERPAWLLSMWSKPPAESNAGCWVRTSDQVAVGMPPRLSSKAPLAELVTAAMQKQAAAMQKQAAAMQKQAAAMQLQEPAGGTVAAAAVAAATAAPAAAPAAPAAAAASAVAAGGDSGYSIGIVDGSSSSNSSSSSISAVDAFAASLLPVRVRVQQQGKLSKEELQAVAPTIEAIPALLQGADVLAAYSGSSSSLDPELQAILAKQRQQVGAAALTLLQFVMQQCPEYLEQQQRQGAVAAVMPAVEQLLAEDGFDFLVWRYNPLVG